MRAKLGRVPFVFAALCFAGGIWLQRIAAVDPRVLAGFFLVFIILAVIFHKRKIAIYPFGILFLVAGSLNFGLWDSFHLEHPVKSVLPQNAVSATIIVNKPPAGPQNQFTARLQKLNIRESEFVINRDFLIRSKIDLPYLNPGDRLILRNVSVENLPERRNPGQFDYGKFLADRGIMGVIQVGRESTIGSVERGGRSIVSFLYNIREKFTRRIEYLLPGQTAAFLTAILLGEKAGISPDIKSDFQNSGVAHVLAISGLHVSFVVLLIYILISVFPVSFRWHNLLTILVLTFYAFLTGANPPVIRATLMVSIYMLGIILERKPNIYNTVFTAAFVILLFSPNQLFSVGFQFSFLAVLSILFFYNQLQPLEKRILQRLPAGRAGIWADRGLVKPFLVSLAAQLGTIPLMAIYFHKIPLISFVLNLVVIPLAGLVVPAGILVLAISYLSFGLANLVGEFLHAVIQILFFIVHQAANLPLAYIQLTKVSVSEILLYLLLLGLAFGWYKSSFAQLRKPAVAFAAILFFWIMLPQDSPPELMMLDVGQGDASMVRTASGKILLFDAGPSYSNMDSGEDVILPALQYWGSLHIDKLFISHPHADHFGGLFSLTHLVSIDTVYLPDVKTHYHLQDSLLSRLQKNRIPFRFVEAGCKIRVDDFTRIYIYSPFSPDLKPASTSGSSINNTSLVFLLKMKKNGIVFTGDAERVIENKLTGWADMLKADVLKVAHHGSSSSSSEAFLNLVSPQFALISVGRNNKYGHPSPSTINRLRGLGYHVDRTDRDNAVIMRLVNQKWRIVNWR